MQKAAYEMRISDWSSDVCSSDLLREVYAESGWAKKNILIGVAGGANDGTSGVREAADQTIRREIEGFAHVIFASSEAQREFWLGRKPSMSADEIRKVYGGLKPCLHGSDAHDLEGVASPFGDRFSWIKGGRSEERRVGKGGVCKGSV